MLLRGLLAIGCALVLLVAGHSAAAADDPPKAIFALIIGSNVSVDAELAPLKYADDDAARYLDLFRLLGARTYLLSRLDENTQRLHAQAAAEAQVPRRAELDRALVQVAADVEQARARGVETTFYFIYAGHGSVRNGQGYITLEDARLTGQDLATQVVGKIPADRFHIVIDACDSYLVAYSRGAGGDRRAIDAVGGIRELVNNPRVGLLLSSSSSRESHEWEGFQAGVFSHEVRSGLYGAADADGDGQVSYREIAAFVSRASMAIPNERFRPEVHARAPSGSESLLDLRSGLKRRLEIDGKHAGHYVVEDGRGVRIADFHNGSTQSVALVRPSPQARLYVRRLDDDKEFFLEGAPDVLVLASLTPEEPRAHARGAAHEAFSLLFSLPFDRDVVAAYPETSPVPPDVPPDVVPLTTRKSDNARIRRIVGFGALGAGVLGVGAGAVLSIASVNISRGSSHNSNTESQADLAERNARVVRDNTAAVVGYAVGGAAVVAGVVLLLWPNAPHGIGAGVSSRGATIQLESRF